MPILPTGPQKNTIACLSIAYPTGKAFYLLPMPILLAWLVGLTPPREGIAQEGGGNPIGN